MTAAVPDPDQLARNAAAAVASVHRHHLAALATCFKPSAARKRQLFEAVQVTLTVCLTGGAGSDLSTILINLPHDVHCPETDSGCLITKDLPRAPADYEATGAHYAELLREAKCHTGLTVLPLRELTVAYMPFEAKRRLCSAYDYFLADVRIAHRLGNKLGSHFLAKNRRKLPIPVNLEARDLAAEIDKGRRTVRLFLAAGSTASCLVGRLDGVGGDADKSKAELAANVTEACRQIVARLAVSGRALTGLYLRHPASGNVPIYVATAAPADVDQVKPATKKKAAPDLDKDLAELGQTLWDKELLAKQLPKKTKKLVKKAKTATAPGDAKAVGKRKSVGKFAGRKEKLQNGKGRRSRPGPKKEQQKPKQKKQKG